MTSIAAYNNPQEWDGLLLSDSADEGEKKGQGQDDADPIGTDQTTGKLQAAAAATTPSNTHQWRLEGGVLSTPHFDGRTNASVRPASGQAQGNGDGGCFRA
ncbi:unnamed protein product [Ectocarpus sp. 8 AP-2014]